MTNDIIIENAQFRLTVGSDCIGKSLICKATNEECLVEGIRLPLFTVTQERPFHNEIKLAFPCKRTVYAGNSLRREGDKLIVGFDLVPYDRIEGAVSGNPKMSAFCFARNNENYIVYWHHNDNASLEIPLDRKDICLFEERWEAPVELAAQVGGVTDSPLINAAA